MTRPNSYWKPVGEMVEELNRTLRGWGHYFCLGAVSRAYRRWTTMPGIGCVSVERKHRSQGVHPVRQAPLYLHRDLGLLRLAATTGNARVRKHESS